ncbi:hypothetical protein C7J99_06705 [Brevibacillus brevis]|nr:hypothetical protein C7J99_06705 [Brevibacillus brevis]
MLLVSLLKEKAPSLSTRGSLKDEQSFIVIRKPNRKEENRWGTTALEFHYILALGYMTSVDMLIKISVQANN